MGVIDGAYFSGDSSNFVSNSSSRDHHRPLLEVAGCLPDDAVATLRSYFATTQVADTRETFMDIKSLLLAAEEAGLKITTENVAPLVGQLINLGIEAAQKGIKDLSHKAGVADVTQGQ